MHAHLKLFWDIDFLFIYCLGNRTVHENISRRSFVVDFTVEEGSLKLYKSEYFYLKYQVAEL